jgi:hypothetical protein
MFKTSTFNDKQKHIFDLTSTNKWIHIFHGPHGSGIHFCEEPNPSTSNYKEKKYYF